jgi:hypothetical protein
LNLEGANVEIGTSFDITTWSAIEVSTSLICTSAPAMKPVISKAFPHLLSSVNGTYGTGSSRPKKTMYGTNSIMARSRRTAVNQPIELSSQNESEFGRTVQNRTTNKVWRGDDDSIRGDDGDSQKGVLSDSQKVVSGPQGQVLGKRDILKTVTLKIDEHGSRRTGSTESEGNSMKGFEHV